MPIRLVSNDEVPEKESESTVLVDSLTVLPPSLFAEYLLEREKVHVLETEQGMAIYVINLTEVYIRDIYVKPEFRKQKVASKIADIVVDRAKKAGCTFLTGTVVPSMPGSDISMKVLQGYGMRLLSCKENLVVFIKDIV
jgi:GNAT superfamily N-acetyltransferase